MKAAPKGSGERGGKQTAKVQRVLRGLLLDGALPLGERLVEEEMVERVGASRTPLRMALVSLQEEGLLDALPSGGFVARAFTEPEVLAAIEIRGTLEGLAARFAAERHPSKLELQPLRECLSQLDVAIGNASASPKDQLATYADLNKRFHAHIAELASNQSLSRQLERASALPFAASSALVMAHEKITDVQTYLIIAQDQHHEIVEAIERHDGTRAESLMREHSRLSTRNLARILSTPEALALVPGSALIVVGGHRGTSSTDDNQGAS
ncbi:GntR family transcriptional regulator [Bradyrhizobium erythrophlei]|uniref:GntR family transcriptional regulator n=1 Tax=Bradyrhizobium erythrophlei TaxID=1437360 RepID=UPI0035EDF353